MRQRIFIFSCLFSLLLPVKILKAESEMFFGGTIKLFTAAFTADDESATSAPPHKAGDFSVTRGELRLKLDGYASDNVSFKTQVYFVYTAAPNYQSLAEIESGKGFSSGMHDVDVYFKEAKFKLIDFLVPGLDLIIGRQRVRWGTSDEYNVIDNLNPVDYANLFLFDPDYFVEHLPMDGLTVEYRFPFDFELKLQAVYFLYFQPSSLPAGFQAGLQTSQQVALNDQVAVFTDFNIGPPDTPRYALDKGVVGLRLSSNILNYDVGLSYYHGYMSLPLPKGLWNSPPDYGTLTAFYEYPRLDVLGVDLAGEFFSIGIWAEAGVYFPEKHYTTEFNIYFPVLPTQSQKIRLLEDAYTKYTIGIDYTFGIGSGLYWNFQYNHGFYDEMNYTGAAKKALGMEQMPFMGELEDYFIAMIDYSFFSDELKLTLGGMLEVADYNDFSGSSAWLISPEIEYKPFDGTTLRLGYALVNGASSSKFGAFSNSDVCFLLLKTIF